MRKRRFRLPWFGDSIGVESPNWRRSKGIELDSIDATAAVNTSRILLFNIVAIVILLIFLSRIFSVNNY